LSNYTTGGCKETNKAGTVDKWIKLAQAGVNIPVSLHESLLLSDGIFRAFVKIGFGIVTERVGQVDNSK
jgi:hypothetical protein